jgi:hypothetical protein
MGGRRPTSSEFDTEYRYRLFCRRISVGQVKPRRGAVAALYIAVEGKLPPEPKE